MPWLQWKLPSRTHVVGVSISDVSQSSKFDNKTHKTELVNYEIRAGLSSLPKNHQGEIVLNTLCGRVEIRGGEDRVYPIVCNESILADYLTVQVRDDNAMLKINELEIIKEKKADGGMMNDLSKRNFLLKSSL